MRIQQCGNLQAKLVMFSTGLVLLGANIASGALINFDINGRDSGDPATPPTFSGAAAVGNAGDFWNSLIVTNNTITNFTASNLKRENGVTMTGVDFTVSVSSGNLGADDLSVQNPANALLDDYLHVQSATLSFTISGLTPSTAYDLYLYAQPGAYGTNVTKFTINGVDKNATSSGTASFVENNNYVHFALVTTGSTISGTVATVANNGLFNGFQLSFVPEPSSFSLLVLAGLGLLRVRRRAR